MSFLTGFRTLLRGSDRQRAVADERAVMAEEQARRQELPEQLAASFSAGGAEAVELGTMIQAKRSVRLPRRALIGHTGVWGPSGSGKSYFTVLLLQALMRSGIRRMVVLDPKAETVALMKRAVIDLAHSLPAAQGEELLSQVVTIDLFSKESLPRLQLLAPERGLDPELHAYAIARLITDDSDMGVGVRQEAALHRVIECLIRAGLPLTVLPELLLEPQLLEALAAHVSPPDLFRAAAERLRAESKDRIAGLMSRAEQLLRLSSTRLALGGAPDCLDFGRLLDKKIVLVNLEPPEGSVDIGRFLCGILWVKLTQAIRRRPNGAPPAILVLEEAPAFLSSGGSRTGEMAEDLLRLARSKGVFLYLLSQDLASLGKISTTLPGVIKTNIHLHAIFRTTDDWSAFLPVTGCRRKPGGAPWEERRVSYLERGAELALLKEELARLPDRQLYLLDRRSGLPAVLMRTADVRLTASDNEVRALEARTSASDAVLPVATLEQGLAAVKAHLAALRGGPSFPVSEKPPAIKGRGKRPVEMG